MGSDESHSPCAMLKSPLESKFCPKTSVYTGSKKRFETEKIVFGRDLEDRCAGRKKEQNYEVWTLSTSLLDFFITDDIILQMW